MRDAETWQQAAERLYKEGKSWSVIGKEIHENFFSEEPFDVIRARARGFIRNQSYYQSRDRNKPLEENPRLPRESKTFTPDGKLVSVKFISLRDGENLTPTRLLELHGLSPADFEVYTYTNNYWNSQLKGGEQIINYQSKLIVKVLKGVRPDISELRSLFADLQREPLPPRVDRQVYGNKMAVVHIADLHLGKLCWEGESPENYDYKIARDIFFRGVYEVESELRTKGIEKILFVWSNDFFNSDNTEQTTTQGTPQDTDIREKKLHRVGCQMLAQALEILKDVAPVTTFYTPSNHDEVSAYHALLFLEAWFRNDPKVEILSNPYPRKYIRYGITLLGFCHGNTENSKGSSEKASRLASVMPLEARAEWGKAKVYEMHTGHLHSEQMIVEINGVIVRRISSPTALDNWHVRAGYIGAVRKIQTFIYDKDRGLKEVLNTPV